MRTFVAVLALSLCFAPAAVDSPLDSRCQSPAAETATQKQAWDLLEKGASDHNIDKRANAIQALGLDIGDTSAVRMAENALADPAAFVRAAAAKALGALGSPDSVPKLQPLLNDEDISVALAAGHALVELKSNSGYDLYYALVVGNRKGSRSLITEELDQMRTPSRAVRFAFDQGVGFLPYGGYGMEALHAWRKRNTSPTRAAAARELADDPDPRTGEALAKAVSDNAWVVRAAALEAIAKRGNPILLADIVPAMSDKKEIVRYSAAAAVLRLSRLAQESPTPR
jgi:HEAT repeat protein